MAIQIILCILIGYVLGNISPSFFLAWRKGYDARVDGSGNAGASNAYILAGKSAFFITAILDILKAFIACRVCRGLFETLPVAEQIGGVACILGHMYPAALRFKGGKGLASLGGVILSWNWKTFLILLALAAVIAFVTNYVCFVAPTMAALFPALFYWRTQDLPAALILLIPFLPILLKHMENFRRIREGKEVRMRFMWDRAGELKRIGREHQS